MKPSYIIIAVLSLAVPVLVGTMVGHTELGLVASLGGLALINEVYENSGQWQSFVNLEYAIIFSTTAFMIGMAIAGTTLFSLAMLPAVIFIVSTFGEINRRLIINASRFTVFLIIGYHFEATKATYHILSSNFLIGTMWTSLVLLILKMLSKNKKVPLENQKKYTAKQYLNHWIKSLSRLQGWQFPIRMTLCILIAQIIRYFVPDHHSYWILLTIALVTQHNTDNQPRRIRNRGLGTLLGVCVSFFLVYFAIPVYLLIIIIAVLASLRVMFRETNYLLYAAVMTPLVIILLDFGTLSSITLLLDRLIATLIGCVISFVFSYFIWRKLLNREFGEKPRKAGVSD